MICRAAEVSQTLSVLVLALLACGFTPRMRMDHGRMLARCVSVLRAGMVAR